MSAPTETAAPAPEVKPEETVAPATEPIPVESKPEEAAPAPVRALSRFFSVFKLTLPSQEAPKEEVATEVSFLTSISCNSFSHSSFRNLLHPLLKRLSLLLSLLLLRSLRRKRPSQ